MSEATRIKRYALVPGGRDGDVRRFHLARVTSESPSRPERLERMEEVADRERRSDDPRGRI